MSIDSKVNNICYIIIIYKYINIYLGTIYNLYNKQTSIV